PPGPPRGAGRVRGTGARAPRARQRRRALAAEQRPAARHARLRDRAAGVRPAGPVLGGASGRDRADRRGGAGRVRSVRGGARARDKSVANAARRTRLGGAVAPVAFAVDTMLGRLARWLRILGHDVVYGPHLHGRGLVSCARREGRVIVTRDTRL